MSHNNANIIDSNEEPSSASPLIEQQEYKEYRFRFIIVALFSLASFCNGMCWVTVTPISVLIGKTYNVADAVVSLVPMSYMILYLFINFPSMWVLDEVGIKKGVICGAVLTALGSGIRCLVNKSFAFILIGQSLCALGQPFLTNAPTKVAARWFLQKNRSLALAVLFVSNIIGTLVGFVVPSIFVEDHDDKIQSTTHDQFETLLIFQFAVCMVACFLVLIFFKQKPPKCPNASSMVETLNFKQAMKTLFTSPKFIAVLFTCSIVNGSFNVYGTLLDNLLDPYGFKPKDVSTLGGTMTICGIVSACLVGLYLEKTLNYKGVFKVFGILGSIDVIAFSVGLVIFNDSFIGFLIVVIVQGIVFVPAMPLCFDYGVDIMFPVGEAQITGLMMSGGQIAGLVYIFVGQLAWGLGKDDVSQKTAALATSITVSVVSTIGCITALFFNSKLVRTEYERSQKPGSLLD